MEVSATEWERGRFDARRGPQRVLFGRMYEDAGIELSVFTPGTRVFCIASAGCTAMKLAPRHEVLAVDINPVQLAYAARRFEGAPAMRGTAERVMDLGRRFAPLVGWPRARVREFLDFDDAERQLAYFRAHLDTRRFRAALDGFFSLTALRAVYARGFLDFLPPHLGRVMRGRMERGFARHPNRSNPYARALLAGEPAADAAPPEARGIRLAQADAAAFLEAQPAGRVHGFTLSNILDGATAAYRQRLFAAVQRAAAPGAVAVLRSFGEPPPGLAGNRAADDRSMLWGIVQVVSPAELR